MTIVNFYMARRVGYLLAVALPLSLVTLAPRIANADPDPAAVAIARVSPAVVRVVSVRPPVREANKAGTGLTDASASVRPSIAFGSGYIIDPSGYVGTNRHVVNGAISVFVMTADGVRYPAQIVGMPKQADLALLKIDPGQKRLPFVKFGDSDKMQVGDKVIAIGSPFGFDTTATEGIISALNRDIMESPFDNYLQTDAAINHGNSGGPLFNLAGEVVGMTSVIVSPDPASAGVGFAIPSSSLQFIFDRLMRTGQINAGMLPIHAVPVTWMLQQALGLPDQHGALVKSVTANGDSMSQDPIKVGDVIRMFNGTPVTDPRDLARQAARSPVGSDAVLEVYRDGEVATVHATLLAWPEMKPAVLDDEGPRALGLELVAAPGDKAGQVVKVASVDPTGSAADSGIRKGDIILEVQQTPVTDPDQALRMFQTQSSLKRRFAAVLVERDNELYWISLVVPG